MRHIHVELTRGIKEELAPVELPAHVGDLPPPTAPSQGPDPGVMRPGMGVGVGVPRPFGQEELRLQKVYQLSIFSHLGGFSASDSPRASEAQLGQAQRAARARVKRGLEEPKLGHKRPHLVGDQDQDGLDGGVLCGTGPGMEVGVEVGQGSAFSGTVVDNKDHEGGLSPRSPPPAPLSPGHTPARRPAQHNHDRPVPDPWAPLSPKSPPMAEPHCPPSSHGPLPNTEPPPGGDAPAYSLGDGGSWEVGSGGSSSGQHQPACRTDGGSCRAPSTPAEPVLGTPGSLSPHPTDPQEQGDVSEWGSQLESPPPHPSATTFTNGLASPEKTPSSSGLRGSCSGVKKKLLSSSDTGESCSEDEGPSTSKRSRLALLAPGLGLASCRGTDAKAAPFWNHLLPGARHRDLPKSALESARASRRLKSGMRLKSRQLRSGRRTDISGRSVRSGWPPSSISRSLLGNFEESILKGRFSPSGRIEGFTAEIGASGSYCPQHATLPVHVTYYDISEHSAPSPFLGVVSLEPLGKKGYNVPKTGTIQVTLFNPNKTVVKMFLVTYNFGDMPVNHMTFLRHRIFLVPVEEVEPGGKGEGSLEPRAKPTERRKILCYLIHLRFQSSKSGKIYLHNDIRLLFSRKSVEVDTGIPYELKSFTEVPRNPKYSPRV
ncbi:protein FAM214B [Esox lucius]|uniref:Atos homolog protein B n=1 Tax=Esox lucius TaxID=8010 RepID=A0A3P8Z239_ESOLU|nr:protein FAM214B [Esox lucius]XP_010887774.2 protein FAM214B [Esox lucius]XP_019908353.2 protein FAM214B [Esox lucius]